MRSAVAPTTSAGVIIANFIWNKANSKRGMVGASGHGAWALTPFNIKKVAGLPTMPWYDSPKAMLKPHTTQKTLMSPVAMKLCNIVEMTFFLLTIPP